MRERFKTFLALIVGLVGLALLVWLITSLFREALKYLSTVDPKYAAGLAAAFATIVVSIISILVSKYYDRKSNIEKELRDKKVPIYENLITFVFDITLGDKVDRAMTEKQVVCSLAKITQDLVVWGSPEVIKAYSDFRKLIMQENVDNKPPKVLMAVESVFWAIRKDLGHKDKNLAKGTILSLYVNDIHEFIAEQKMK